MEEMVQDPTFKGHLSFDTSEARNANRFLWRPMIRQSLRKFHFPFCSIFCLASGSMQEFKQCKFNPFYSLIQISFRHAKLIFVTTSPCLFHEHTLSCNLRMTICFLFISHSQRRRRNVNMSLLLVLHFKPVTKCPPCCVSESPSLNTLGHFLLGGGGKQSSLKVPVNPISHFATSQTCNLGRRMEQNTFRAGQLRVRD